MKKIIILVIGGFISFSSIAEQVQQEAEGAIRAYLINAESKSMCSYLAGQVRFDVSKRTAAIASCDNDFVVSEGLKFSEVGIFTRKSGKFACGIVSGKTAISRIGARFVYDSSRKRVTLKYSKYPLLYSGNTEYYKNSVIIQTNMYRMESSNYCK